MCRFGRKFESAKFRLFSAAPHKYAPFGVEARRSERKRERDDCDLCCCVAAMFQLTVSDAPFIVTIYPLEVPSRFSH